MIHARPNRPTTIARRGAQRAGNSLVLVTALLVLLVIIATAYLSRTRAERVVSVAQQQSSLREDRAAVIADELAREIAEALFVRPINKALTPVQANNPNVPRLPIPADAVRYGVDTRNTQAAGAPRIHGYEFNHAPYHTVPFTNWPDFPLYPRGTGNPGGPWVIGESNPIGWPGFGDARWLRDTEPVRIRVDPTLFGLSADEELYVYSHWRKITNIARAENGWRIVFDISRALDDDVIVTDLRWPVEQWRVLPYPGAFGGNPFGGLAGQLRATNLNPNFFTNYGTRIASGETAQVFIDRWQNWMANHPTAHANVNVIPNNFYRLSDLDADGNPPNPPQGNPNLFEPAPWEMPGAEFAGPGTPLGGSTGTLRWSVSRTLADADGDGYTDSFWFLAPTMIEGGLRQVVAVSIVDNGGLVNVNTASRFVRSDTVTGIEGSRTTGQTPADVALIGQNVANVGNPLDNWNTGLLDTFLNQSPNNGPFFRGTSVQFDPAKWSQAQTQPFEGPVREVNVLGALNVKGNIDFPNLLGTQLERARHYRSIGASFDRPGLGLTPFGIADEIELRMYRASNNPETLSRLERTFDRRVFDTISSGVAVGPGTQGVPFRSDDFLEESSDLLDRLSVPDLVRDLRWKTTTYNATRNDLLPPWLWPSAHPRDPQLRYDFATDSILTVPFPPADPEQSVWLKDWDDRIRKVDLRREPIVGAPADVEARAFLNQVTDVLMRAFATARPVPTEPTNIVGSSLFGDFASGPLTPNPEAYKRSRKAAASFAANILAARDPDDNPLPVEFLTLPNLNINPDYAAGDGFARRRYPGMERHPFLVEAFIGHVYPVFTVPAEYPNGGARAVFSTEPGGSSVDLSTTIVVVQIANPFDRPLPLRNLPETPIDETQLTPQFELEIFGQAVNLRELANAVPPVVPAIDRLQPATDLDPHVLTLYAIVPSFAGTPDFRTRWLDFLDVPGPAADPSVLPWARSIDMNSVPGATISTSRNLYDTSNAPAVQLVRIEGTHRLVVDRIDRLDADSDDVNEHFGAAVRDMLTGIPPEGPDVLPPTDVDFPIPGGWQIDSALDGNHWVQWRRTARSFGYGRSATRANPRYVFGNKVVIRPLPPPGTGPTINSYFRSGHVYRVEAPPDTPWFGQARPHFNTLQPGESSALVRKPTTFNLRWGELFYSAVAEGPVTNDPDAFYPDTGFYHSPFAMQMMQRNRDFDRIGDLSWVWLWGPEMDIENAAAPVIVRTFAEVMSRETTDYPPAWVGQGTAINRLRLGVTTFAGTFGTGDDVIDPRITGTSVDPSIPALPASVRVFDAFTVDGAGLNPLDIDGNGTITAAEREQSRLRLAGGFTGRPVHGLINVNTAPREVVRTLPHLYRLIDEGVGSFSLNPRVRYADAIVNYRDRIGDWDPSENNPIFPGKPAYGGRGEEKTAGADDGYLTAIRGERGIAGVGELLLADLPAIDGIPSIPSDTRNSWRRSYAARGPFGSGVSTRISTDTFDRVRPTDPNNPAAFEFLPDAVAADLEEETLLFAGAANMVTTRSDTFTVYFRVRTFRQDPSTGRWDATKFENIVDDSRYVMVVDRSQVNSPRDRPRILFLEKMND